MRLLQAGGKQVCKWNPPPAAPLMAAPHWLENDISGGRACCCRSHPTARYWPDEA